MFIMTAKLPKKRLLAGGAAALCCCGVLLAALIFSLGSRAVTASAEVNGLGSNEDRIAYLNSLGWEVSPSALTSEELLIPQNFDDSYASYLALQTEQGFDLTRYCGERVKRYTYQITNYPGGESQAQAVLLIYRDRVVGGQVQSPSGDFLHGLTGPAATPQPSGQPAAPSSLPSDTI